MALQILEGGDEMPKAKTKFECAVCGRNSGAYRVCRQCIEGERMRILLAVAQVRMAGVNGDLPVDERGLAASLLMHRLAGNGRPVSSAAVKGLLKPLQLDAWELQWAREYSGIVLIRTATPETSKRSEWEFVLKPLAGNAEEYPCIVCRQPCRSVIGNDHIHPRCLRDGRGEGDECPLCVLGDANPGEVCSYCHAEELANEAA